MLLTPEYIFRAIEAITPEFLRQHGITALVLDVDNTLTGDGSQQLDAHAVQQWLDTMRVAGVRLTIVSNSAATRVRPFADRVGLAWVPLGLQAAARRADGRHRRRLGVTHNQMAMVGDQLYADRLAAALYRHLLPDGDAAWRRPRRAGQSSSAG